jgi:hypothetical protein
VNALGTHVHDRWISGQVEGECRRVSVDHTVPEARLVERPCEVVDEDPVRLPRLGAERRESHELAEPLELYASRELAPEVAFQIAEEKLDEGLERKRIGTIGGAWRQPR